ncbi:FAD-binding oxidoreductase [Flavivirga sp. 57AJ16]
MTIKRVKAGKVSNYLNDNIEIGNSIKVLSPMGNFKYK